MMHQDGLTSRSRSPCGRRVFQVWIGRYSHWVPNRWSEIPPRLEAIERADSRLLPRADARQIVEGFNRRMLRGRAGFWAVAVPVRVQVQGAPQRGQMIESVRK
jgi:hypothetical protein